MSLMSLLFICFYSAIKLVPLAKFNENECDWRNGVKRGRSSRRLFPMLESVNNKNLMKEQQSEGIAEWYIAGSMRRQTRIGIFYNRPSPVRQKRMKLGRNKGKSPIERSSLNQQNKSIICQTVLCLRHTKNVSMSKLNRNNNKEKNSLFSRFRRTSHRGIIG